MEIWVPVKDFEEFYEVSNEGVVRSKDRICDKGRTSKGRTIKQWENRRGYKMVTLSKHGKQKHFPVHRLVAIAYLENPENLPCINHKDENRTNNNSDNLEWCNYQYNNTYRERQLVRAIPVAQIKNGETIATYKSVRYAGGQTGICYVDIIKCAQGKNKHAGGYQWKYL